MRPGVSRRLDRLSFMSLGEIEERDLLPLLEREVEVVIQGLLDLGSYIISSSGWAPPSSYSEIGHILARHGVLPKAEGERISRMARLRDIVVHAYPDIDYAMLHGYAAQLRLDARRSLEYMLSYMRERGIDP